MLGRTQSRRNNYELRFFIPSGASGKAMIGVDKDAADRSMRLRDERACMRANVHTSFMKTRLSVCECVRDHLPGRMCRGPGCS